MNRRRVAFPSAIASILCAAFVSSLETANAEISNRYAEVTGSACYPSEGAPPMTIYARNTETKETFSVTLGKDAGRYVLKVPVEGEYVVFLWTHKNPDGYPIEGAIYSHAVPCGLNVRCTDHRPLLVRVKLGQRLEKIDVCDYYYPRDRADEFVPKP